jgi:hypothetical protein
MSKDNLLYSDMFKFYENKEVFDLFIKIVAAKNISLRTIDWFITSWSHQNRIILYWNGQSWVDKQTDLAYINIYGEYINNLNTYSKKYFDIFRRKNNSTIINFMNIPTNLAQLIFCKWMIESKIAHYILTNQEHINNLYKQHHKESTAIIKVTGTKKTRYAHEISVCIN